MSDAVARSSYYNVVVAMLLAVHLQRTRSAQDPCGHCPAGTFCQKNRNQICVPCPPRSFSSTGGQRACDICTQCEGVLRVKRACSATSDAVCECGSGLRCVGPACDLCEPDCARGQELTAEGCKDCSFGTFNDQEGGACRPWTNCSLAGKSVLTNGTKDRDEVCGPTPADSSPGRTAQILSSLLALTASASLLLLLFLVLPLAVANRSRKKCLYIFKQPFLRPAQTAQEEDACSCRFPEEEEGGHEL